MKMEKTSTRQIMTLDIETDPFRKNLIPKPFAIGLYDGETFYHCWGKHCVAEMMEILRWKDSSIIYVHNGGKFDAYYLLKYFAGDMVIKNGRILKAYLPSDGSRPHEFRDSYAILPIALREWDKDDIDYRLMQRTKRERHKAEILQYLKKDCVALHEIVMIFRDEFGDALTIGTAAIKQLRKFYKIDRLTDGEDLFLRNNFYLGGRVECLESGQLRDRWNLYDVNSMYPYVMARMNHPVGCVDAKIRTDDSESAFFVTVQCYSDGAFAVKQKDGTISFPRCYGTFCTTIYEYRKAIELRLLSRIDHVEFLTFSNYTNFDEYITPYYMRKQEATERGDKAGKLLSKLFLNNAYGKLGQNPRNFTDAKIISIHAPIPCGYKIHYENIDGLYRIIEKPTDKIKFLNVATAASITGAARSVLLEAIATSERPVYCDTDSLICRQLSSHLPVHKSELGAWDLEASGDNIAIGGKKLYALFHGKKCVKKASKGVAASASEIKRIVQGETIKFHKLSPSFKWDGTASFVSRNVRSTT